MTTHLSLTVPSGPSETEYIKLTSVCSSAVLDVLTLLQYKRSCMPSSIIHTLTKQSLLSLCMHACVCLCARTCLSRCEPGHPECTMMFLSKCQRQPCWLICWENGIPAICLWAPCWAPSLWLFPSAPKAEAFNVPRAPAGHVTERRLKCLLWWA